MSAGSSGFIKVVAAINVALGIITWLGTKEFGTFLVFAIGGTLGSLIYLAPTIVALERGHHNRGAVAALNILLGWAVIPWVAALIWAMSRNTTAEILAQQHVQAATAATQAESAPDSTAAEYKACPYCAEQVKKIAIKCKHCGSDLRLAPDGGSHTG
jgi:hypothetical protein